jgi:hypothetical protein
VELVVLMQVSGPNKKNEKRRSVAREGRRRLLQGAAVCSAEELPVGGSWITEPDVEPEPEPEPWRKSRHGTKPEPQPQPQPELQIMYGKCSSDSELQQESSAKAERNRKKRARQKLARARARPSPAVSFSPWQFLGDHHSTTANHSVISLLSLEIRRS